MKSLRVLFLVFMIITTVTACSQHKVESAETQNTPASTQAPTPSPSPFVPEELFGSPFNPFHDAAFPGNFNVYSASFDIGVPKLGGRPHYILSMTAEGKTDESITFLAKLAGIEDAQTAAQHAGDFKNGGFCEFPSAGGGEVFTIRATDPGDDRYEYVGGFHADIRVNLSDEEAVRYIQLVRDNFNVNALAAAADYFDVTPVFDECGIAVNLYKKEVITDLRYDVKDVAAVEKSLVKNVKGNWYDVENGKMGLSYGMLDIGLHFDSASGNIYVSETTNDMKSVLSAYVEAEVSFVKLGFQYFEKDQLCLYEVLKPHYMSVAVCRPDWGSLNDIDGWNIEYMDEVNGYSLRITYSEAEDKYRISVDKNKVCAAFDYLPSTKEYGEEYPDQDTVKRMFNGAFGTQDEDFYEKPMAYFAQLLQERFSLSVDELYALPIR